MGKGHPHVLPRRHYHYHCPQLLTISTLLHPSKLPIARHVQRGKKDRSLVSESADAAFMPSALEVGERIEARFGGGPDFHPGVISAVNDDESYNIAYDDGDKEESVKRLRIKRPGDKKPKIGKVGMKCEARHGGGKVCFDGTISAVDDLGTYAIDYDDGDKEQGVAWALIFVQCEPKKSKSMKKLFKEEAQKGALASSSW